MTNLVIDTNVFLRLFLNDIPSQANISEKLITKAKEGKLKLLVPQIVFFEIEFALSKYYKFPKSKIVDHLNSIISASYIEIEEKETLKKAVSLYIFNSLSLPDCFIRKFSEVKNADLFTFDKKLKKLV